MVLELISELKKRKKLEPTSMARPAASASSIAMEEVMPELPSAEGQSLWCMINTGGIGLGLCAVEIKIHARLFDAIKILKMLEEQNVLPQPQSG